MSSPVSTISWQGAEHRHHGAQQRQHLERLAPAARRLGLAQEREGLAHGAQLVRLAIHAPGHALDRAEQVDQHRHVVSHHVLEQYGRAFFGEQPGLDLRHLEIGRDRRLHAHEAAGLFEPVHEVAKRGVGHRL
jgi:hypothetical protein